jgi:hypothetical protein
MQYETLLKWSMPTTIWLFILSITLTSLTAAYWIIGDFIMPRYTEIFTGNIDPSVPASSLPIKMVEYIASTTDATIVSSCIGLIASVVAFVSWFMLRRRDMDREVNMVWLSAVTLQMHNINFSQPRRRFWVGVVVLCALATFASALAALILHFTELGPDEFGCKVISDGRDGQLFYCTREVGACKVIPAWKDEALDILFEEDADLYEKLVRNPWSMEVVCGMSRAVKWMQILLMLSALAVGGLFLSQAIVRHRTRYERMELLDKGKEVTRNSASTDGGF